tara:strand:+ start:291 stop:596 length:306 start_codon:yes stop_codon:yes gene_type:complete
METVLSFFRGLDAFQWVLIVAGLVLLWPTIQERLVKLFTKTEDVEVPVIDNETIKKDDLTSLVYKWEVLYESCRQHDLNDACDKLKEVFPMLIKPYEKYDA